MQAAALRLHRSSTSTRAYVVFLDVADNAQAHNTGLSRATNKQCATADVGQNAAIKLSPVLVVSLAERV